MNNQRVVTLKQAMTELGLTPHSLLARIHDVTVSLAEERASIAKVNNYKRAQYIDEAMKDRSISISRATLYNALDGKRAVSQDKALLIRRAINETRKLRRLREYTEDELIINVYYR